MCLPIAAAALLGAGTLAKYFGEKKAENAQNAAYNAERQRQSDLEGQQTQRFQDSLDKTKNMLDPATAKAAVDARAGTLSSAIVPQGADGTYLPGSSSAPSVVATASDKSGAASAARDSNLAQSLAALGATGDQLQTLNTGIGRNSQTIGQLGGFKAGSLAVLPSEMEAAAAKGGTLRSLGGLAQQIGSAILTSGIGGANPSGAASAAFSKGSDIAGKAASSIGSFASRLTGAI